MSGIRSVVRGGMCVAAAIAIVAAMTGAETASAASVAKVGLRLCPGPLACRLPEDIRSEFDEPIEGETNANGSLSQGTKRAEGRAMIGPVIGQGSLQATTFVLGVPNRAEAAAWIEDTLYFIIPAGTYSEDLTATLHGSVQGELANGPGRGVMEVLVERSFDSIALPDETWDLRTTHIDSEQIDQSLDPVEITLLLAGQPAPVEPVEADLYVGVAAHSSRIGGSLSSSADIASRYWVEASPGVTIMADSGSGPVGVIPLPGAMVLMASALAALGLLAGSGRRVR